VTSSDLTPEPKPQEGDEVVHQAFLDDLLVVSLRDGRCV